jgi:hypothetical protein
MSVIFLNGKGLLAILQEGSKRNTSDITPEQDGYSNQVRIQMSYVQCPLLIMGVTFMTNILQDKMVCLLKYGVPRNALAILTAGGMYFEEMGGIPFREYWITDAFDNRDEFFLIANTSFSLAHLAGTLKPKNESPKRGQVLGYKFFFSNSLTVLLIVVRNQERVHISFWR